MLLEHIDILYFFNFVKDIIIEATIQKASKDPYCNKQIKWHMHSWQIVKFDHLGFHYEMHIQANDMAKVVKKRLEDWLEDKVVKPAPESIASSSKVIQQESKFQDHNL